MEIITTQPWSYKPSSETGQIGRLGDAEKAEKSFYAVSVKDTK